MIPLNKVKDLISRHVSLEAELSSGKIDKKKFAEKSKEYSDLNNIVKEAKAYSNYENEKNDLMNVGYKYTSEYLQQYKKRRTFVFYFRRH